jgi:D-serine deaminase-like pyridoxal phosphate-dependent protein
VLIECDTGGGRCGVQSAAEVVALAQQIRQHPGLTFGGLMTFPPVGKQQETDTWLTAARDALAAEQIDCARITSSGTPGMWGYGGSIITEYRPGTYIYMDRYQVAQGSRPPRLRADRARHRRQPSDRDAPYFFGLKALTSDTLGMNGFGEIIGKPGALVTGLSEEHGVVTLATAQPQCRRTWSHPAKSLLRRQHLFDQVYFISGDTVVDVMPVAARGGVA